MTPKQRFLLQTEAEPHRKLAHLEQFAKVLDFALLEMFHGLPRPNEGAGDDGLRAAANFYRMEGARLFRQTLETIADRPVPPPPSKQAMDYRTT